MTALADAAESAAGVEHSRYRLVSSGLVLSALSFALVLYAAGEEPFFVFRWCDLALNVLAGAVVFVLFATWAVLCVRKFRAPPVSTRRTLFACACVLWTAINLFYLGGMIYGYGQDMTHPQFGPWR